MQKCSARRTAGSAEGCKVGHCLHKATWWLMMSLPPYISLHRCRLFLVYIAARVFLSHERQRCDE